MDKDTLAALTIAAVAYVVLPTSLHLVDRHLIAKDSQRVECDTRCYAPTARVTVYNDRTEVIFQTGDLSHKRIVDYDNDGFADRTYLASVGGARAMGSALIGVNRHSNLEEQVLFTDLLSVYQKE